MTKLSPQEIRITAHNAGFRGNDEVTATAIALAESAGETTAISPPNTNGTKDYGLFQINSSHFGKLKLDNGVFGVGVGATYVDATNMLNPQLNAQAAYILYQGRNNSFGDWSTFNDGSYKKQLPAVTGGTTTPKITGNIAQDTLNTVKDASGITGALTWLGKEIPIVGFTLLALVLFALGVFILVSETKAGKAVAKVAAI